MNSDAIDGADLNEEKLNVKRNEVKVVGESSRPL
jgi:hypothetical protein